MQRKRTVHHSTYQEECVLKPSRDIDKFGEDDMTQVSKTKLGEGRVGSRAITLEVEVPGLEFYLFI